MKSIYFGNDLKANRHRDLDTPYGELFRYSLYEFISLIETIVLSDDLSFFVGYDDRVRKGLQQLYAPLLLLQKSSLMGWDYTIDCPDGGEEIFDFIIDQRSTSLVYSDNIKLAKLEQVISWIDQCNALLGSKAVLNGDTIAFDLMVWEYEGDRSFLPNIKDFSCEKEYRQAIKRSTNPAMRNLLNSIKELLGEDWLLYEKYVFKSLKWPRESVKPLPGKSTESEKLEDLTFALSLFEEFRLSKDVDTISMASFNKSGLYNHFESQEQTKTFGIIEVLTREYASKVHSWMEENGMASINSSFPPIFRMACQDAKSVLDVVKNAYEIKKSNWAVEMRRCLTDLRLVDDPQRFINSIQRIKRHLDKTLNKFQVNSSTKFGVSVHGNISISFNGLYDELLRWKSPIVLVNSHMINEIGNRDTLRDLAQITNNSPAMINSYLQDHKP